jgi:hypothetical protein
MEPRNYNFEPYRPGPIAFSHSEKQGHKPAGSSEGGQFASGEGGGSSDTYKSSGKQAVDDYIEESGWFPADDDREFEKNLDRASRDGIVQWTSTAYTDIREFQKDPEGFRDTIYNKMMDEGEVDSDEAEDLADERAREMSSTVEDLDNALDMAPRFEGTIYRGMHSLDEFEVAVGDEIELEAHASWTKSTEVLDQFSTDMNATGKTAVRFIAKTKIGRDISGVSHLKHEKEVMLLKGHAFRVKAVNVLKDNRSLGYGQRVIEVELEEVLEKTKRKRTDD